MTIKRFLIEWQLIAEDLMKGNLLSKRWSEPTMPAPKRTIRAWLLSINRKTSSILWISSARKVLRLHWEVWTKSIPRIFSTMKRQSNSCSMLKTLRSIPSRRKGRIKKMSCTIDVSASLKRFIKTTFCTWWSTRPTWKRKKILKPNSRTTTSTRCNLHQLKTGLDEIRWVSFN